MTLTLELSPAEEAALTAQANARRQAVADRAHELLQSSLGLKDLPTISDPRHDDLIRRLQAAGLLTKLPTRPGQLQPFQPIPIIGPPISQTLVEDREPRSSRTR